jgi:hypothetical protein
MFWLWLSDDVLVYWKVVPDNTSAFITLEGDGSVFIANNPTGGVVTASCFVMLADVI